MMSNGYGSKQVIWPMESMDGVAYGWLLVIESILPPPLVGDF